MAHCANLSKKIKFQKNFKKLTFFVDFFFFNAYNSASTEKSRVLANIKKGFKYGTFRKKNQNFDNCY